MYPSWDPFLPSKQIMYMKQMGYKQRMGRVGAGAGGDQEQEGGWQAAAVRVCLCNLQD